MSKEELQKIKDSLDIISEKEPEALIALGLIIGHISGTYGDKYEKDDSNPVTTKKLLYHPEKGGTLNTYQSLKYLQRYVSEGSKKSNLITDLYKAVHYMVFEVTRRVKKGDIEYIEHKN